ncbi:MAG: CHRD domain-containing protein [Burkholderiales bacterium]|nr:CHRD domain-containing protein [Burkholderiales bacterium]MBK8666080.1 CHRD domain-containing protein [Burkholderiales bacterium]
MSRFVPVSTPARLAATSLALLAVGCSSVDLGPRYDPPPVRAPQPLPPAPAPLPPIATPQPIPPAQPVPQPLPPIGTPAPLPPPPLQTPVDPTASPNPQAHLVTLTTRLDGASVMPPARSNATGQLDALYDSNTRLLRWKTSWSALSGPITAVQFHGPAEYGQTGPVTMVWPAPFGPTYEGRATLTPQQAVDLLDGRWYVNVFTAPYPSGELRGQLRVVH